MGCGPWENLATLVQRVTPREANHLKGWGDHVVAGPVIVIVIVIEIVSEIWEVKTMMTKTTRLCWPKDGTTL